MESSRALLINQQPSQSHITLHPILEDPESDTRKPQPQIKEKSINPDLVIYDPDTVEKKDAKKLKRKMKLRKKKKALKRRKKKAKVKGLKSHIIRVKKKEIAPPETLKEVPVITEVTTREEEILNEKIRKKKKILLNTYNSLKQFTQAKTYSSKIKLRK